MVKLERILNKVTLFLLIAICLVFLIFPILVNAWETDTDNLGDYYQVTTYMTGDDFTYDDVELSSYSSSSVRDAVYDAVIDTEFFQEYYDYSMSMNSFYSFNNYGVIYDDNGYFHVYVQDQNLLKLAHGSTFDENYFWLDCFSIVDASKYYFTYGFFYQYEVVLDTDYNFVTVTTVYSDDNDDYLFMWHETSYINKFSSVTSYSSGFYLPLIDSYNGQFYQNPWFYSYWIGRMFVYAIQNGTSTSTVAWEYYTDMSTSHYYYRYNYSSIELQYSGAELSSDDDNSSTDTDRTDRTDDIYNSLTDDSVDGSTSTASSFFDDFESDDYGLSDIITLPLQFIKQITSTSCTPISIPLPFVNQNATLPCISSIFETYFGSFLSVYQVITFGLIAYRIGLDIYSMVKGFKDPDSDKIEVVDL